MALSEEEERVLAEMAKSLYEEDPKLARVMRDPKGNGSFAQATIGALSTLGGLALVIAGVAVNFALLGVAGFAVMLFGSWRLYLRFSGPTVGSDSSVPKQGAKKRSGGKSFMDTVNDRWDRRQQER